MSIGRYALFILLIATLPLCAAPVHLVEQEPSSVERLPDGVLLADFGKVAFGNLEFEVPGDAAVRAQIAVHFGEALSGGRIDRKPPGTVRYARVEVDPADQRGPLVVAPPADKRNTDTSMNAVLTPKEWGVILPFRWVEIEGWPAGLAPPKLARRAAFAASWDDSAASFVSSNDTLNAIWELCRYSIKATTFAGVYVDGDRERIPYEADAYLNQLSHYSCDPDPQMARDTFDYLMRHPTWPTEWSQHMILMAHADWMRTGDVGWLAARYESLEPKMLMSRARADGLLEGTEEQIKKDIVDWPVGERDGYVFKPVNTVVNAFYLQTLKLMAELARAVGKADDVDAFAKKAEDASRSFQAVLFDSARGLYRDGEGTDHASLHANLFPLAFGLVPAEHQARVLAFLKEKGMRCSVYVAQYLMEALFRHGAGVTALDLILAPGDRSWRHMLESGTTITWEAWDQKYKPNQDWNHAWGAAPANLLPRFVLGVEAVVPGWKTIRIRPDPGGLTSCRGQVPSLRGPVEVEWSHKQEAGFDLSFHLPPGMTARLEVPVAGRGVVQVDGKKVRAVREGGWLRVEGEWSGRHRVEVR